MSQFPPIGRRPFLRGAAAIIAAGSAAGRALARPGDELRPEQFGAKGDGRSDDTPAFQAMGRAVSERGGGTIVLRPRATYRLGRQTASRDGSTFAFSPQPTLPIDGVNGLVIQGNGAILKLNDGLRYGAFDPATGRRYDHPEKGGFTRRAYAAIVGRLIEITNSSNVRIADLVLDGNADQLLIGGRWGDTGIQLAATGLSATRVDRVLIENVVSRNNGLDGIYIRGRNVSEAEGAPDDIVLRDVRCDRNGRQGVSVVGGRGLRFERCTFANTGQGPVASMPKAGVDLEPNGRNWTTDATFEGCAFVNNRGVGLLADTGNSRGLTVRDCTFWQGFAARKGVTLNSGDAFWLGREGVLIDNCRVHGNVTHLPVGARVRGTGFDDAVHPVLGRAAQTRRYLLDAAGGTFSDCSFAVTGGGIGLIYAKPALVLRRCRLHHSGTGVSAKRALAVFSPATTLENVTFTEPTGPGAARHFIAPGGARLLGKVIVTGPNIRWGSVGGPTGDVAAL